MAKMAKEIKPVVARNPDIFGLGSSFLPAAKPTGHRTVRVVVVVDGGLL